MAGFFDEGYYLSHKVAQLAKDDLTAADGSAYTPETLKTYFSELGITPEAHYKEYGRGEALNPNPYFNETEYLTAKKDLLAQANPAWVDISISELRLFMEQLGVTPAEHYEQYGAFESDTNGVLLNPSNAFDANAYFAAKLVTLKASGYKGADTMSVAQVIEAFKAAGANPISHYTAYGAAEATATNTPLVQTVPSEQRVANDPARTENVPGNYNPPTMGAANPEASAVPVAKPADVGAKVPAAVSPPVVAPANPLPTPADPGYVTPPAGLVDTNAKPVAPPSPATGGNWAQVNPDGSADLIKPDGTPGGTLPDGSLNPSDPSIPPAPLPPDEPTPGPKPEPAPKPDPTPPAAKTFDAKLTDGTLTFEGTATGEITMTVTNGAATFTCGKITDSTPITLSDVQTITVGAGYTLKGAAADIGAKSIDGAGSVVVTGVTDSTVFTNFHADTTVTAQVDSNEAFTNIVLTNVDKISVSENFTLTGPAAVLSGTTIEGKGTVQVTFATDATDFSGFAAAGLTVKAEMTDQDISAVTDTGLANVDEFMITASFTAAAAQVSDKAVTGLGTVRVNAVDATTNFSHFASTLVVIANVATGFTLAADKGVANVDTFTVAADQTLTGTSAQLSGKAVNGAGCVVVTDTVDTTNLNEFDTTTAVTAQVDSNVTFTNIDLTNVDKISVSEGVTLTGAADKLVKAIEGEGSTLVTGADSADTITIATTGTNTITGGKGKDAITLGADTGTDTIVVSGGNTVDVTETSTVPLEELTAGTVVDGALAPVTPDMETVQGTAGSADSDSTFDAYDVINNFQMTGTDKLDLDVVALLAGPLDATATGITDLTATITAGVVRFGGSAAATATATQKVAALLTGMAATKTVAIFTDGTDAYVVQGDGVSGAGTGDVVVQLAGVATLADGFDLATILS